MQKLRCGVLVLLLLVSSCGAAGADSEKQSYSDEPVVLSVAEADSILDLIDDQALRIALLETDLWQQRRVAQVDSALAAVKVEVRDREIEELRGNVVTRFLKHPVIWLALGVWLAGQ
jgi:hypothetical protein